MHIDDPTCVLLTGKISRMTIEYAYQGRQSSTVLIGDLNGDFGNTQTGSAHSVHRILASFGLQNYVNAPTRVTSHSQSTIDLFLSTTPIQGPCEIMYLDISDHYAVLARLPCKSSSRRQGETMTKSRRLHRVDWNTFQVDLASTLNSSFNEDTIDSMACSVTDAIVTTLIKHPAITLRRRNERRPCPWLTDALVACVRERNRLHRRLRRNRADDILRAAHRKTRAKARRPDRRLKNLYFIEQCATADQKKLWAVMNTVTGRTKSRHAPQVTVTELNDAFGALSMIPIDQPHCQCQLAQLAQWD